MALVADLAGMTIRTLQRHLKRHDLTYLDLMRQVRGFVYNSTPVNEWFSVSNLFDDVGALISPEAARQNVKLCIRKADGIEAHGSQLELQQLIMNLVLNAIQAARTGEAAVVNLDATCDPDGVIRISVEDNGPGIDVDDPEKLFDPFVTSRSKGTGIGLAVVRRIALRHGGQVNVRNRVEGGARFEVVLPIGTPQSKAAYA